MGVSGTDAIRLLREIQARLTALGPEGQQRWADEVIEQRRQWISETMAVNRWIAFRDWLSGIPILRVLGKGAWEYYEEHYPGRVEDLAIAMAIKLSAPVSSAVWASLERAELVSVTPMEQREEDQNGS